MNQKNQHSSNHEYHCDICKRDFKGPTYFRHLKSKNHYENVRINLNHNRPWIDSSSNYVESTLPMDSGKTPTNGSETLFLQHLHEFLGKHLLGYSFDVTRDSDRIRLSLSFRQTNRK